MKKTKQLLCFLLAAAMLICLASCGREKTAEETTETTTEQMIFSEVPSVPLEDESGTTVAGMLTTVLTTVRETVTTAKPTTAAPTTVPSTTEPPATQAPTTVAPTTIVPTTVAPTTAAPTTAAPSGNFTFTGTTPGGSAYSYDQVRGSKLVMINCFESWCGPCVNEIPELEKLYENYKDKGFVIIGVYSSSSNVSDIKALISSKGITYPVIFSEDSHIRSMDSGYVPNTFFVDGNGNLLSSQPEIGAHSYSQWVSIIGQYGIK